MEHQVETSVEADGTITLHDLPFHEGERVVVTITEKPTQPASENRYPLRGLPITYIRPFDPVDEDEWSAAQ